MDTWQQMVTHVTKTIGMSHCAATHTAQNNFQVTNKLSRHFIKMMEDKVTEYKTCHITNMDQSPIP